MMMMARVREVRRLILIQIEARMLSSYHGYDTRPNSPASTGIRHPLGHGILPRRRATTGAPRWARCSWP